MSDKSTDLKPGPAMDAAIAERVFKWGRYKAICYGKPCVMLAEEYSHCWNRSRTQKDPGTWEETTEPLTKSVTRYWSTDIKYAWEVVEYFRNSKDDELRIRSGKALQGVFSIAHNYTAEQVSAAICRAALAIADGES